MQRIYQSPHFHVCLLLMLVNQITLAGDTGGHLIEQDFLTELNTVSSVTRLKQDVLDSPSAVTIIDRDMIRLSGITEVPQLLRLAPGYFPYKVFGSRTGVTTRGLSSKFPGDLEVMIDGRSIYDPLFSGVEWSSIGITVQDIERIEVVRSSNAPSFGSNAFLGAVNIITTQPQQKQGSSLRVSASDQQTRDQAFRHFGHNDNLVYRIRLSHHADDGFPGLNNPEYSWQKATDDTEHTTGNIKLIYTPNIIDTLELEAGLGHSRQEFPDTAIVRVPRGYIDRDIDTNYQLFRWTRDDGLNNKHQLKFQHSELESEQERNFGLVSDTIARAWEVDDPGLISSVLSANSIPDQNFTSNDSDAKSHRYDLEYQNTLTVSDSQRLVWGAGSRYDSLRGEVLFDHNDKEDDWSFRLFANHEWQLGERWQLNSGVMAEKNDIVDSFLSPRLALNYRLAQNQSLRLAATRGHRTPSLLEVNQVQVLRTQEGALLIADIDHSEKIEKARIDSFEIGYVGKFMENQLLFDWRVFHEDVNNAMGLHLEASPAIISPYVGVRSSTVDWRSNGTDMSLRYQNANGHLISAQYAYNDIDGRALRTKTPLTYTMLGDHIPRHSGSLMIGKQFFQGIETSIRYDYQSATQWSQGDSIEAREEINLRAYWPVQVGSQILELEAIYQHSLGDFGVYSDINQFEDTLTVGITLNF